MAKLIITQDFWDVFPETEIAVVLAHNITNRNQCTKIVEDLQKANEEAKRFLSAEIFSENKAISVWREAYRKFKTKKGVRSSIENLLKRIEKENPVGKINPLVDIYNTISLSYGIPCGGQDIDTIQGDMLLTKAVGGEPFLALGEESTDCALPEEIVYKDEIGIVCRCWNWRDGARTMLTENTQNAVLIIESVDPARHDDLIEAANKLASLVEKHLEGSASVTLLSIDNREVSLHK